MATNDLYLDLLEKSLTRSFDPVVDFKEFDGLTSARWKRLLLRRLQKEFGKRGYLVTRPISNSVRQRGEDWPTYAETMIGVQRLRNIRSALQTCIAEGIPGDFVEAGVWRGGASIYASAVLEAAGDFHRRVWVADSFEGLPSPTVPQDEGLTFHLEPTLAVTLEQVKENFSSYGLLSDRVRFIKGWFKDTLPGPIESVAVLRLDGDMYESTWSTLCALEPLVSESGFVIVDDYNISACRQAIEDYRSFQRIDSAIVSIDGYGVYWRKGRTASNCTSQS